MQLSELKPGLRLEVRRVTFEEDDKASGGWQVSQLLEIPQDETLHIAVPIEAFRHVDWPLASLVDLAFVLPGRGLYSLRGKILEQGYLQQVAYYRLQAVSGLKRSQRRRHFRLDCTLDLDFELAEENEATPKEHTVTRDISGGGASFVSDQPLPEDAKMKLHLQVDEQNIEAIGRVVRCEAVNQGGLRQHVISLQFTDLSNQDQDKLIQYIFQRQHQRLKNQPEGGQRDGL